MKLSQFGQKFAESTGIVDLMDDLGSALNENPEMIFMGGGNPGRIPKEFGLLQITPTFSSRLLALMLRQGSLKWRCASSGQSESFLAAIYHPARWARSCQK